MSEEQQDREFLDRLRARNEGRRNELDRLITEYQQMLVEAPETPTSIVALETELDLWKQLTLDYDDSNVAVTSLLGSTDRPSKATVERLLRKQFAEETAESYQDLAKAHHTLEMVLERENQKLAVKKAFVEQQKTLFLSLKERKQLEKKELTVENFTESQSAQLRMQKIRKENEWIRKELHYVCQKLIPPEKKEEPTGSKLPESSSKRESQKKRRKKNHGEPTGLENAVLELTRCLLEQPENPYLLCKDETNISVVDVKLLRQCGVVQSHPENENMLRLTDFRK